MNSIWFTSDTHYNHKGIVRGTSSWENKQRCRDFDTVEEHNEALVKKFNELIKSGDTLYHLGDWSFGGFSAVTEFWKRLPSRLDIHLIYGNHDHHIERNKEGVQALFKSVQYVKEARIGSNTIVLSHYAHRVWNHSHKGSWMLYGHSHGSLDKARPEIANPTWIGDQYFIKNYKTMDVGVDTNNLLPYSYDELALIMKDREVMLDVDHHGSTTN